MSDTSANLAGYADFVRKLFAVSGDPSKDFTHAILGIVTEAFELVNANDAVHALEEKGDLIFYMQALIQVACDHEGLTLEDIREFPALDIDYPWDLTDSASDKSSSGSIYLMDQAKRWVGYGKAPESLAHTVRVAAAVVYLALTNCGYALESSEEIVSANMKKLLKRYPDKVFNQEHALVRDLAGERKVLEDAAALG